MLIDEPLFGPAFAFAVLFSTLHPVPMTPPLQFVYAMMLSRKKKAHRRSFLSATHATDSTCRGWRPKSIPVTPPVISTVRSRRIAAGLFCSAAQVNASLSLIASTTTMKVLTACRIMLVR